MLNFNIDSQSQSFSFWLHLLENIVGRFCFFWSGFLSFRGINKKRNVNKTCNWEQYEKHSHTRFLNAPSSLINNLHHAIN